MQVGSLVTIGTPFNAALPGQYPVIYLFGDGSAAVMVPGWVQEGTTFNPAQGANFAGSFLTDTGSTVLLSSLNIPTSVPPAPAVPNFIQIVSASTPALNGQYAIDQTAQQNIGSVTLYLAVNSKFPAGQAELPWFDVNGAAHLFPTIALWQAFATAVADFVMKIALGQIPTNPVSII